MRANCKNQTQSSVRDFARAFVRARRNPTVGEVERFCQMVAKVHRVPCRVLVRRSFASTFKGMEFCGTRLDAGLYATHKYLRECGFRVSRRGSRCFILVNLARIKMASTCWRNRDYRERLFAELLSTMAHESAHHFVSGHGSRWRSRCAKLAHRWGLKLSDCWP